MRSLGNQLICTRCKRLTGKDIPLLRVSTRKFIDKENQKKVVVKTFRCPCGCAYGTQSTKVFNYAKGGLNHE